MTSRPRRAAPFAGTFRRAPWPIACRSPARLCSLTKPVRNLNLAPFFRPGWVRQPAGCWFAQPCCGHSVIPFKLSGVQQPVKYVAEPCLTNFLTDGVRQLMIIWLPNPVVGIASFFKQSEVQQPINYVAEPCLSNFLTDGVLQLLGVWLPNPTISIIIIKIAISTQLSRHRSI